MPQRARQVLTLALALAWGLLPVSPAAAQTTPASPPSLQQVDPDPNALKLRFGIEYWVRASNIDNFDFDGSLDDNLNFGWHRIKPFFGLRKRWFELVLQGQDARSHNVPEQNPNGTLQLRVGHQPARLREGLRDGQAQGRRDAQGGP